MDENTKQFYNPDDNCIYFYDSKKQCYMKICAVGSYTDLPPVIRQQILAVQEDAKHALMLPTK